MQIKIKSMHTLSVRNLPFIHCIFTQLNHILGKIVMGRVMQFKIEPE